MQSKFFLTALLFVSMFFTACKDEFSVENEKVSGAFTLTQKSFEPLSFDAQGMPTKAKVVQDFNGTISNIGTLTTQINVVLDLVSGKSEEVLATYKDQDGDSILTKSSSVSNPTGLVITETITGGTGKFAKITGSGTYPVQMNFVTGTGTGTLEWTVTY